MVNDDVRSCGMDEWRTVMGAWQKKLQVEKRLQNIPPLLESSDTIVPRERSELERLNDIVSQRGFLRQQLALRCLTPLSRWFYELKLLLVDEKLQDESSTKSTMHDDDEREDVESSLAMVLRQDKMCYDVSYTFGRQIHDLKEVLLDDDGNVGGVSTVQSKVREILRFSTLRCGVVCCITCVSTHLDNGHLFHSSIYIPNLQKDLDMRLQREPSLVKDVIAYLWDAIDAQYKLEKLVR